MSTAIVKVTPLSGAKEAHALAPSCTLLQIDQANILLDCGHYPHQVSSRKPGYLGRLKDALDESGSGSIDMILLSHGDCWHVGGLAWVLEMVCYGSGGGGGGKGHGKMGNKSTPPLIISTIPCHHLGLLSVYEGWQGAWHVHGQSPSLSLDAIDHAFSLIRLSRHHQTHQPPALHPHNPRLRGLTVTPLPSGHSLGGACWRIRRGGEDVLYLPMIDHRRECVVDGAQLQGVWKPSLMIAGVWGGMSVRKSGGDEGGDADDGLWTILKQWSTNINAAATTTAKQTSKRSKRSSKLIVVCDAFMRWLECIQIINSHLIDHSPPSNARAGDEQSLKKEQEKKAIPPIYLLAYQSARSLQLASGLLEWTSMQMQAKFEQDRRNPFTTLHPLFKVVHSCKDIPSSSSGGEDCIVVVPGGGGECGWIVDLLVQCAEDPNSLIVRTSELSPGPPSPFVAVSGEGEEDFAGLLDRIERSARLKQAITLEHYTKVPLAGTELLEHRAKERLAAEQAAAQTAFDKLQTEDYYDDDDDDEGEDGESKIISQEKDAISNSKMLAHVYWNDYRRDWWIDKQLHYNENDDHKIVANEWWPLMQRQQAATAATGAIRQGEKENYAEQINRYQTFTEKIKRVHADDYGQSFSLHAQEKKEESPENGDEDERGEDAGEQETINAINIVENTAHKWIKHVVTLTPAISIQTVALQGTSDGRALRTIYERIDASNLLLIGGGRESTLFMLNHFQQRTLIAAAATASSAPTKKSVWAPANGESVVVGGGEGGVLACMLSDSLVDGIRLDKVGDYEVAVVRGLLVRGGVKREGSAVDDAMDVDAGEDGKQHKQQTQGSLLLDTTASTSTNAQSLNILLGNPKLSLLRNRLLLGTSTTSQSTSSIPSTFHEGTLICGAQKRIRVHRDEEADVLVVESDGVCDDYYVVRDAVYGINAFLQ